VEKVRKKFMGKHKSTKKSQVAQAEANKLGSAPSAPKDGQNGHN
jgi:hypothetical protein